MFIRFPYKKRSHVSTPLREINGQAGPSTGIQLLSPGLSHSGNKPLARHGLGNKLLQPSGVLTLIIFADVFRNNLFL
jgi:hypothetical protein